MFVLEYDQSPFTGYLHSDSASVPPHVFLHRVAKTDAQTLRKHLLRRVCGEPSFTALVRAFEASGMINDFWDYGIVGARLSIYYRLCARFLGVSDFVSFVSGSIRCCVTVAVCDVAKVTVRIRR